MYAAPTRNSSDSCYSGFRAFAFGGANVFPGHSDINATSSTDPNDAALFTLIDNVRVEQNPAAVPEPGTLITLGAGLVAVALRKHRKA